MKQILIKSCDDCPFIDFGFNVEPDFCDNSQKHIYELPNGVEEIPEFCELKDAK